MLLRWLLLNGIITQPPSQLVPTIRINDGGMLALKYLSFVPYPSCIDRIGQDVVQLAARP